MDACEPRGENLKPSRQFGCRYSFVRELAAEEYTRTYAHWEHDRTLVAAFTLSRLISTTPTRPSTPHGSSCSPTTAFRLSLHP